MIHLMGQSILELKTNYSFRQRPMPDTTTRKTIPCVLIKRIFEITIVPIL